MRRFLLFFTILIVAGLFTAKSFENKSQLQYADSLKVLEPKDYYKGETELINTIISRYHYNKINLNDSLSEEIFSKYFNTLDRNKSYFFERDIKKFQKYKDELDDLIKAGDLKPAYEIFKVFRQRANDRINYVLKTLKQNLILP